MSNKVLPEYPARVVGYIVSVWSMVGSEGAAMMGGLARSTERHYPLFLWGPLSLHLGRPILSYEALTALEKEGSLAYITIQPSRF